MYKFNNNSIFTYYLKGMLHDFNLPGYEAWTPGKLIYKDHYYIYRNFIVKALETARYDAFNLDKFKIIMDNYVFGNKITNVTKNLRLDSLYYDTYTHTYLGKYLRFYRDYTGVDLMPLYNCFSEISVEDLLIEDISKNVILQSDANSVVYMIDVVPEQKYTIYLDCKGVVEMAAGYYDESWIHINSIELTPDEPPIVFPYERTYFKVSNTTFNRPFIYSKLKDLDGLNIQNVATLYDWRDKLKLFIKIPRTTRSSLVILEGDHLRNSELHFENTNLYLSDVVESKPYINVAGAVNSIPDLSHINTSSSNWLHKSQITSINGNMNYPFSDRLVEYLIGNTIDATDPIDNNIARIQDILLRRSKPGLTRVNMHGVWDDQVRSVVYGIAKTSNLINTKNDILGYVDKDVESLLNLKDGD